MAACPLHPTATSPRARPPTRPPRPRAPQDSAALAALAAVNGLAARGSGVTATAALTSRLGASEAFAVATGKRPLASTPIAPAVDAEPLGEGAGAPDVPAKKAKRPYIKGGKKAMLAAQAAGAQAAGAQPPAAPDADAGAISAATRDDAVASAVHWQPAAAPPLPHCELAAPPPRALEPWAAAAQPSACAASVEPMALGDEAQAVELLTAGSADAAPLQAEAPPIAQPQPPQPQ
jgi:hypothetical protein